MTIEAELFDGTVLEFPDGTSPDVIKRVAKEQTAAKHGEPAAPPVDPAKQSYPMRSYASKTAFLEGLPIVGPAVSEGIDMASAGIRAPFTDKTYAEELARINENQRVAKEANPSEAMVGNVAGQVAGSIVPATAAPRLFGMTGSLGSRVIAGGLSNAGMAGADTAVRGGSLQDVGESAALGGTVGAVVPALGAAGKGVYRAAKDRIGGIVRGAVNPAEEATRRIGSGFRMDAGTPEGTMSPADYQAARANSQPLINADLGGEHIRAIARSAANTSPDARAVLEKTANDRFASQGDRVTKLVNRLTGGRTDDILAQEGLKDAAAAVNGAAYKKAENSRAAQSLWNGELAQLMQSPAVRDAVRGADKAGANRAAVEGFTRVKNPFVEMADGTFSMRNGVAPNLRFWDQVKRNLDDQLNAAGKHTPAGRDLIQLKGKLVSTLDSAVPEYKAARQGAARFFGAEDALEAGKKFAKSTRMLPEYKRGVMSLRGPERELFETGFASELIDAAKAGRDNANTIKAMFGSQENREKMLLAFGQERAREIEAFVRVEHSMDKLRGALGNSTTARQLIESGALGLGAGYYSGDWKTGVMAAAAGGFAARRIEANVMKEVAKMLTSDDPQMIAKAVKLAAKSPQHMAAIEAVQDALLLGLRGASVAAN